MEIKQATTKTFFMIDNRLQLPSRHTPKPTLIQNEASQIGSLKLPSKTFDTQKPIKISEIMKDFSSITTLYNKKHPKINLHNFKNSKKKLKSMSPEPYLNNMPKIINLNLETEGKNLRYASIV